MVVAKLKSLLYNSRDRETEVKKIKLKKKVDMAISYADDVTKKDIADRLGISPSGFNQRLNTGKFTQEELEMIASVLNAEYVSYFQFPDGKKI